MTSCTEGAQADGAELERAIGLPRATAMVVGTIIGASIFVQPSEITGQVPSVAGVFAVWIVSGALTLVGALVCAELSSIFRESGGVYVYLREAYGRPMGFLWGWAMFWSMHSGIIAAIAVVCARYVAYFVPGTGDAGIRGIAVAVILVLSAINYLGVREASGLQALFTWGKLLAIGVILVVGVTLGSRVPEHFVADPAAAGFSATGFALALVAGLFAFGGWHMVTYNAEETLAPQRTIPRALIIGTLVVTACYVAMNAVYMYVLPLETVAGSTRIAADLADALLGTGGGGMMSALVVFSTFGALTGIVLAGPRVYLQMARDGLLFESLAAVHPRYRTPHRAILLQAVWSSVLVATGTYRELFTRVIYTEWIFFGLMALGLMLLRRRPGLERHVSIPGYPVLPLLFAVASFAIVANQVVAAPAHSLSGLALVVVGLPVYALWSRRCPAGS